jgi:hypothetical protein
LSQLLRMRCLSVFRSFSLGCHVMIKILVVCSNIECLRLIGRRDFQMIGGGRDQVISQISEGRQTPFIFKNQNKY